MEYTFKYAIGQQVKLVDVKNLSQYRERELLELKGKTVKIIDRGFQIVTADDKYWRKPNCPAGMHVDEFYYIKEDPFCSRVPAYEKTRIPVECLEGDALNSTVEIPFVTKDGVNIVFNETKVYYGLIREHQNKLFAECSFTFCSYGKVNGVRYNWTYNDFHKDAPIKEIQIFREFLCYCLHPGETEPRARQDSCRYGNESWEYLNNNVYIYAHTPENYPELYVQTAYKDCIGSISERDRKNPFEDNTYSAWERKQWLMQLGVYDEVKELYYKQQPQKYKMTREELEIEKFKTSAKEYVNKLSSSEREALKKLLNGYE